MEPVSLSSELNPVTGFTLELDGRPTEISRILGAIGSEMDRIRHDNQKDELDMIFAGPRPTRYYFRSLGVLNVKGILHTRKGI